MQQSAMFFMQIYGVFEHIKVRRPLGQQIQLKPHMPHKRRCRAHFHRQPPARHMTFCWPYMATQYFERQEKAGAALNDLPV